MDIYVVKKDETIEDIAKRFNLTVNDLQSVNDINLYEIKTGDNINIPFILTEDFIYYKIVKGDTLKQIAKDKNINVTTLAYLNGLDIDDYIYPEQTLLIPKENVKVYITKSGDTIKTLEEEIGFKLDKILEDNPEIYLVENQLLIERDIT